MKTALLVVLGALVVLVAATLVERRVLRPRREAAALVIEARPLAAASNEAQWLGAESLLAQAELRHRGRRDVAELRALIAGKRAAARLRDDQILAQALAACVAALETAGLTSEAKAIRDEVGKQPHRDLHVRCMTPQLKHLQTLSPAPPLSPSVSASP
ncbi:MAG: hypothetical protein HYV09_25355 [Deltaproteobacteria bacterium]|nr:hypothetical protein [Deltaproteobacteria bacterium]